MNDKKEDGKLFVYSLDNYLQHIESLYYSFPLTNDIIKKSFTTAGKSFNEFLSNHGIKKVRMTEVIHTK